MDLGLGLQLGLSLELGVGVWFGLELWLGLELGFRSGLGLVVELGVGTKTFVISISHINLGGNQSASCQSAKCIWNTVEEATPCVVCCLHTYAR